ncbi:hypothetical protein LshimejAT787_1500450 [Lyophyllum shimeji]|uniref:Uncharacterized protein n=1 Tax=Lyophyllum shimeji TaxID=47721 RepID=A0A9P3PZA9_LYOSH|nr:hypothetical protein LshimejAT787_1500450 [Lyophyllum shimeji]
MASPETSPLHYILPVYQPSDAVRLSCCLAMGPRPMILNETTKLSYEHTNTIAHCPSHPPSADSSHSPGPRHLLLQGGGWPSTYGCFPLSSGCVLVGVTGDIGGDGRTRIHAHFPLPPTAPTHSPPSLLQRWAAHDISSSTPSSPPHTLPSATCYPSPAPPPRCHKLHLPRHNSAHTYPIAVCQELLAALLLVRLPQGQQEGAAHAQTPDLGPRNAGYGGSEDSVNVGIDCRFLSL